MVNDMFFAKYDSSAAWDNVIVAVPTAFAVIKPVVSLTVAISELLLAKVIAPVLEVVKSVFLVNV